MKLKKLAVIFILAGLACVSFTPALTAEIITRHEKTDSIDNIVTIENKPVIALNANDEPNYSPGDVLVVFKSPQMTNNANAGMTQSYATYANSVMSSVGGTVTRTYSNLSQATGDVFALVHSDTIPEEDLLAQLRARPDVAAASLNYKNTLYDDGVTPNDSLYDKLWGMKAIKAPEAWTTTKGSQNVYVAVIDSGVDYRHADIKANFEHSYSKSFAVGKTEGQYDDENGHGTHVAGTIGAVGNNGIGVAGVNWQTKIISLRIFDASGSCWDEQIVAALDYLLKLLNDNPDLTIAAANMSYGKSLMTLSPEDMKSGPEYMAMKALSDTGRILMCVAAGNDGTEIGSGTYAYPASYTGLDNMIVVANAQNNSSYTRSGTSNYSRTHVDIAAPGTNIWSTSPYSCTLVSNYPSQTTVDNGSRYLYISGTSMATPHVAGTAALLKAAYPDMSASEIKTAILEGANHGYAKNYTAYGFLDANNAMKSAAEWFGDNVKPEIITSELPKGMYTTEYSHIMTAKGTSPLEWSIEGTLPQGLTMTNDGKLSGKPSEYGTFSLTFRVKNNLGTDSKTIELYIDDGSPKIMANDIEEGNVYAWYSQQLSAKGLQPFTWKITAGELPENMKFATDGTITGTPQKTGTWPITVEAQNYMGSATKEIQLTVKGVKPLILMTDTLPSATVGVPYSAKIETVGSQPITWSYVDGALHAEGLSFDMSTGIISGIPKRAQTIPTFRVQAENDAGSDTHFVQDVIIYDNPSVPPEDLTITTDELPMFVFGMPYRARLKASSTSPVTWSYVGGRNVPEGVSLHSDGTISGNIPALNNWFYILNSYIDVKATNSKGSVTKRISIAINDDPQKINLEDMPDGIMGKEYKTVISSMNPWGSVWSIDQGRLPQGLYFDIDGGYSSNPIIYGTPEEPGKFTFTLIMGGSWGDYDKKTYTMEITKEAVKPEIRTKALPEGVIGLPYSAQIAAKGTNPDIFIVENLPDGLVMENGGVITGTPAKAGEYELTARAVNSAGNDSKTFTLVIKELQDSATPAIMTRVLAKCSKGYIYNERLYADGADVRWSVTDGSLPKGLQLSPTGKLIGVAETEGEFTFSVTAENFKGEDTREFTLNVDDPLGPFNGDDDDFDDDTLESLALTLDYFAYASFKDGKSNYDNARFGNINPALHISEDSENPSVSAYGDLAVVMENGITRRQAYGSDQSQLRHIRDAFTIDKGAGSYRYRGARYHEVPEDTAVTFDLLEDSGLYYLAEPDSNKAVSFMQGSDAALKGRELEWHLPAAMDLEDGSTTLSNLLTVKEQLEKPVPFVSLTDEGKLAWRFVKSNDVSTPVSPELDGKLTIQLDIKDGTGKKIIFPVKNYELKADEIANTITLDEPVKISDVMEIYATVETENIAYTWCFFGAEYDVPESPKITTNANLSRAFRNLEYIYRLSSDSNASWDVISGKLPDGLSLNSSGIITGTPTKTGNYSFTVQIENDYGIDSKTFYIAVVQSSVEIVIESGQADAAITTGSKYEALLRASADIEISSWEIDGLNANVFGDDNEYLAVDGVLEEGSYSFTATAYDLAGSYGDIDLKVEVITPPTIITAQIPDGTAGSDYSVSFNASGTAPITWQLTGDIPDGLAFDPATATLYGTPSQAGTYAFTLEASNRAGSDARSFAITIAEATTPSEQPVSPQEPDEPDEEQHEVGQEQTQSHSDYIEEATRVIREKFGDIPVIDLLADTGAYVNYRQTIESVQSMTDQEVAAVLPDIQVGSEGVYLIEVAFENSIPVGSYIIWNPFGVTGSSSGSMSLMSMKYFAAAQGSDDDDEYTFLDDDGNEIEQPTQKEYDHFTVAAHFKANTLYSPVITLEDADTSSQPEETPGQAQEAQEANSGIAEDSNMPEESNNIQPEIVTVNGNAAAPTDDRQAPANRSVSSPASSTPESNSTEAPEESGSGSSGGGGCDVGASVMGLAVLAVILRRYR